MSKSLSLKIPGLLQNVPYCHLRKRKSDEKLIIFYCLDVEEGHAIKIDHEPLPAKKMLYLRVNLMAEENASGGLKTGQMELQTEDKNGEAIVKVEVVCLKWPGIAGVIQPQKTGATTINYQDADED